MTASAMKPVLLEVHDLQTHFETPAGAVRAVDGVSFSLERGRTLAIVGESGSGKSLTGLSILRLVPRPGRIVGGSVHLDGRSILDLPVGELRTIRGGRIAMIFQEPMTSLNPLLTIGRQIEEVLTLHRSLTPRDARVEAINLLKRVGLAAAEERLSSYPHEFSGGMQQRVMIAIALAGNPDVLIADEPTTALDITIQAQILDLLRSLQRERGMAMIFITHDLGVVAEIADDVCVMYAGRIVERCATSALFATPRHPYTAALLKCSPHFDASVDRADGRQKLPVIPGEPPIGGQRSSGCAFHPRCELGRDESRCQRESPPLALVGAGHQAACWKSPGIAGGPPRA